MLFGRVNYNINSDDDDDDDILLLLLLLLSSSSLLLYFIGWTRVQRLLMLSYDAGPMPPNHPPIHSPTPTPTHHFKPPETSPKVLMLLALSPEILHSVKDRTTNQPTSQPIKQNRQTLVDLDGIYSTTQKCVSLW